MSNNEETKVDGTFYGEVNPAVDTSYVDISLTDSNVLYTLNLKDNHAIQNFAINGSQIFTTQRNKSDVILAESFVIGSSVSPGGGVTITNAGHGQTLEYISKGDFTESLLFSLNARQDGNKFWSTEIGIVELSKLKFSNENAYCSYDIFKRFTDLEYANKTATSDGSPVIRADAALSTNQSIILIWTRIRIGNDEYDRFSGYDFSVFCSQLKSADSNTVSFKNNVAMKNACIFSFKGQPQRIMEVPNSFQGIELSNSNNGVCSIYVVSGNENNNSDRIYRFNSNGVLKKAGKITHKDFNTNVKYEIEGVKISGDNLLFGLVCAGDDVDKKKPFIMKISKSILQ